ncbi:MAG: hypothetical protein NVS3B9_0200 [Candidatus Doudnabacteria bacterium]
MVELQGDEPSQEPTVELRFKISPRRESDKRSRLYLEQQLFGVNPEDPEVQTTSTP